MRRRRARYPSAGAMGEVYRARDSRLGRDVAIKVLPEAFARNPAKKSPVRAGGTPPRLMSPHGLEESEHPLLLVMEFVEGETLAARLTSGPIPVDEARPSSAAVRSPLALVGLVATYLPARRASLMDPIRSLRAH